MIGGIRRGAAEEEVGAHQRGGELDSLGLKVICRAQCIQGSSNKVHIGAGGST